MLSGTHLSPPPLQDSDTCEEWERHEALYEDVTKQDRVEERLFEEEIELKWEKGGSGLVFYTDAQYWQEQNGGNVGVTEPQTNQHELGGTQACR